MASPRSHYDVLKIASDAPSEVVRAAYRVLAQKYHPDRNPGNATAAAEMASVNEAYRVLSNAELRQQHDAKLVTLNAGRSPDGARAQHSTKDSTSYSPSSKRAPDLRAGQGLNDGAVDLDRIWASWFGSSDVKRSAPESKDSNERERTETRAAQKVDSVNLNTISDGFAAIFRKSPKK